jgi:hypothetical protein
VLRCGAAALILFEPAGNSVELAPPTLWQGLGYRAAPPVAPGDG